MADHSIYFYFLIGIMLIATLQSTGIGFLFFFKRSGEWRANIFYGFLLISIGLTLLHNALILLDFYHYYPQLKFLPIYYTLSFPVLLFFYVKLSLYPAYRMKWTDIKHFILPLGQVIFLTIVCLLPLDQKLATEREFYNPFYGAFEQFLYLSTFYAYMYFAYRYIWQKQKTVRKRKELLKILYLKKLVKILFFLFGIHTVMVLTDFISYEFLHINMRAFKPYVALGVLSFTVLVFWLSTYGFQVLLWGRRVFGLRRRR